MIVKILAVTTWFPSPASPVMGVFVKKDVLALSRDHAVTVIHLARAGVMRTAPALEVIDGVQVHRILFDPARPASILRAIRRVRSHAQEADLLHTMAFSSILGIGPRRPALPWVHTEHWSGWTATASLSPHLRAGMHVLVRAIRRPDVVCAVSEFLAAPIRKVRSGPTLVVPCIVDAPEGITARSSLDGRQIELLSIGGLVPGKDPLTAVRTVAELKRRGVACRLTWLGEGPLRGEVEREAAGLGLADVVSLPGAVPPATVSAQLDRTDLFLLPTKSETFCISAAEALAHGRPVVMGANGGQAEYMTSEMGDLVVRQDPAAYADAVERVLARLRDTSAQSIASAVRSRYNAEVFRKRLGEVYTMAQQVAARGRR